MRAKVKCHPWKHCYRSCLSQQLRRTGWAKLADRVRYSQDSRRPKFPRFWRKENASLTRILLNAPGRRGRRHLRRPLNIGFSFASLDSAAITRIWKQPTISNLGYSDPWTGSSKCSADLVTVAQSSFTTRMIRKHRQQIAAPSVGLVTELKRLHENSRNSSLFTSIFKLQVPSFFIALAAISRSTRATAV